MTLTGLVNKIHTVGNYRTNDLVSYKINCKGRERERERGREAYRAIDSTQLNASQCVYLDGS